MPRECMPYKVVCRYCKQEFTAHTFNKKYCCEEHRLKARYLRDKERYKNVAEAKAQQEAQRKRDNAKKQENTLSAIAAEAARHGMSYGQYVSYMQQQERRQNGYQKRNHGTIGG